MNNINTSLIIDPTRQQPFLGGSLAFLQNANKETVKGICRSIMGDTKYGSAAINGVAMVGCKFSSNLDTIFDGFIFFNDELFYFGGKSGLNAFSNIPVFVLDSTYLSPDPITFSDGTTGNVHNQRRLKIVDQATGTGLFDVSTLVYVNSNEGTNISFWGFATTSASPVNVTSFSYTTPKGLTGMTRNFRLRVVGQIILNLANSNVNGAYIELYNSTTSTVLIYTQPRLTTTGTAHISTFIVPLYLEYKGTFNAGNVILVRIASQGGITVSLDTCNFIVEEYN
jgi:hypothetical protein